MQRSTRIPAFSANAFRRPLVKRWRSYTNSSAFSPTDTMPLSRWAKVLMLVQSAVSLTLGLMVVARAVNILR